MDVGVDFKISGPQLFYASCSNSRCKVIQAWSKLSFLDKGVPGSTTRQNGGNSARGTFLSLCSSQAYSATIRKNREVDTGHVASQDCARAILLRNCCRDTVSPGRIFRSSSAISCGLEMCSFEPLFTPAKSFSRTTWCGGLVAILSFQVFLGLGMVHTCVVAMVRFSQPPHLVQIILG